MRVQSSTLDPFWTMKSSAITPRPITTGESGRLARVPLERRAAPSTTAPAPMRTFLMRPVSMIVAPSPMTPQALLHSSARLVAKPLMRSISLGLCRYIASIYASWAVSLSWIVTSRPPDSFRTETSTPLPNDVSPST